METRHISRQSLRLQNHDYSNPGIYYFTLVTHQREHIFGDFVAGRVRWNTAGRIIFDVWEEVPSRFPTVRLLDAMVMPDHFHGILEITRRERAAVPGVAAIHELPLHERPELPPQEKEALRQEEYRISRRRMLLPRVIGYIKMNSAKRINLLLDSPGVPAWQRNYNECIIRDGTELHAMRKYIRNNPALWDNDEEKRQAS